MIQPIVIVELIIVNAIGDEVDHGGDFRYLYSSFPAFPYPFSLLFKENTDKIGGVAENVWSCPIQA